jgi:hypothetical protein
MHRPFQVSLLIWARRYRWTGQKERLYHGLIIRHTVIGGFVFGSKARLQLPPMIDWRLGSPTSTNMRNSQDLLTSELEPVFWQLGTSNYLLHAGKPPFGIHTDKLLRVDTCFERDGTALNISRYADWCKAD